jgi:hypothetical protein
MFRVSVGVFLNKEDFIGYCHRNFEIDLNHGDFHLDAHAEAGYVKSPDGLKYFYMLFNGTNPNIGTIAHEAVHVAGAICEQLGIPVNAENDETLAYMVDYLVQGTVDEFRALGSEGKLP